jgi:hypothetical protein
MPTTTTLHTRHPRPPLVVHRGLPFKEIHILQDHSPEQHKNNLHYPNIRDQLTQTPERPRFICIRLQQGHKRHNTVFNDAYPRKRLPSRWRARSTHPSCTGKKALTSCPSGGSQQQFHYSSGTSTIEKRSFLTTYMITLMTEILPTQTLTEASLETKGRCSIIHGLH